MKVCIVGGGASGIYAAIALKRKDPSADIFIIEKESRIGRKLCATGNGKCNLMNDSYAKGHFSNSNNIEKYLSKYSSNDLVTVLRDWGIPTYSKNNYRYPLNNNAPAHVENLENILKSLGVRICLNTRFIDYEIIKNEIMVFSSEANYKVDKLIIATGGKSSPNLGSDGEIFNILVQNHNYYIKKPVPGLVPIKVRESSVTKELQGYRHDASVSLYIKRNNSYKKIYSEFGKILFKKDALSGIVIFNVESIIARNGLDNDYKIVVDLFKNQNILPKSLQNPHKVKENDLIACFPKNVSKVLIKLAKDQNRTLEETIHKIEFIYNGVYDFKNSQVTVGGVDVNYVDENLESTLEKNVYLIGEVLDYDGLCGGYNLTWCLICALIIAESISIQ